jgi:hypothetical protein
MDSPGEPRGESYNPWSVVNLVFADLAEQGLHPILGEAGDPGRPAADLLRAFGIEPVAEGTRQASGEMTQHLAAIRDAMFGDG